MTNEPMDGSDTPVTQAQLVAELKATRADLRHEIANAMNYVVETLGARLDRMRDELSRELAGHVKSASEENRRYLVALDDRYRDLPGRVTVLERELDEHRRDSAMHPPRRRR